MEQITAMLLLGIPGFIGALISWLVVTYRLDDKKSIRTALPYAIFFSVMLLPALCWLFVKAIGG